MRRIVLAAAASLLFGQAAAAENLSERAECLRQMLSTYLEMPVAFPSAPVDHGNGTFTLHDVQLKVGPGDDELGKILSLDVYAFDCKGFRESGAPSELRLRAAGATVPPQLHPLATLLPGLPFDDYIDVDLDLLYAAANQRLTLRQADATFGGIGALKVSLDVTGIDLAAVRITSPGMMALGAGVAGASIHRLSATLENSAGNRFLEAIAKAQGMSMLDRRDSWVKQLDEMAATEGKEAAGPLLRELKAFVNDMRRLTVRINPPAGHVDMVILGTHNDDVGEQIRIAGLSVQANR